MRPYDQKSIKVSYHPANFGCYNPSGSGHIMVLVT